MKPEDVVVDAYCIKFYQPLNGAKYIEHFLLVMAIHLKLNK